MQPAPLPNGPAAVPRFLAALARMRRAQAWVLVLAGMDLAALGDLATGPDLWFGPVYLVVICLAAWSLGWGAGQAAGVACMALTFAINGISLYPYGSAALPANFAMRFAAAWLVVAVIAAMRRAYLREWYLARTDALTGEHLYEDKSTLTIEEIDPAEYMTPERVREIHKECLAEMEARMGSDYWVYRG